MHLSPLYKRIYTALVLIPPVILGILLLSNVMLALLLGIVVILGASEWARLIAINNYNYYAVITGILLIFIWFLTQNYNFLISLLFFSMIFWIYGLIVVWRYPRLPQWWQKRYIQILIGWFVLIPAWAALITLHSGLYFNVQHSAQYVIFLFMLIWTADTAAFFVGKRWGKQRLAPLVSPGKTLEGLGGALIATLIVANLGAWLLKIAPQRWLAFIGLCLITLLSSVLGDLFESVIKRVQGVKDSGMLLPGHGGILDRIDSLTAAAPVFTLGLLLFGLNG